MARTPRLDFPGARHHVMNRASRPGVLFTDDDDCIAFLSVLGDLPDRFDLRIHGFALMPNHYHLMVEVPLGNLSAAMKHLGAVFTQTWNRRHGTDGSLFRGRFRNRVVTTDTYWMHLLAYVHLNPVAARLIKQPGDTEWSSHKAYVDPRRCPTWLTTAELIDHFGSRHQLLDYIDDVRLKRREPPDGFRPDRFRADTESTSQLPPPSLPRRTLDQALDDVAEALDTPRDTLLVLRRGRTPNVAAWIAVWWILQSTDTTQADLARRMGVTRPRIGQLNDKARDLRKRDDRAAQAMSRLALLLAP